MTGRDWAGRSSRRSGPVSRSLERQPVEKIPALDPGQAVWKVGPDYVDIIQTVLSEEEATLTDTSSRRRKAQQALASLFHGGGRLILRP
ncbi:hypothetical protein OG985_47960 [Streptomyces sp. NBC_00289]|uniref:hypothetical protein n=1 Tax=Streptomyces sp. NBC_00289 TaxID=2975703 RepID=UPI0032468E91